MGFTMLFHIAYRLPVNDILVGTSPDPKNKTYTSFEDAKADAIIDLQRWVEKIEFGIERLKKATCVSDLT